MFDFLEPGCKNNCPEPVYNFLRETLWSHLNTQSPLSVAVDWVKENPGTSVVGVLGVAGAGLATATVINRTCRNKNAKKDQEVTPLKGASSPSSPPSTPSSSFSYGQMVAQTTASQLIKARTAVEKRMDVINLFKFLRDYLLDNRFDEMKPEVLGKKLHISLENASKLKALDASPSNPSLCRREWGKKQAEILKMLELPEGSLFVKGAQVGHYDYLVEIFRVKDFEVRSTPSLLHRK